MMKKNTNLFVLLLSVLATAACTQTTPSMMNSSRVELARETIVEQIPVGQLNDNNIAYLAQQYRTHGSGSMDLLMTYNPKAKDFTAMRAVNELKRVQTVLNKKGVHNISAQTLAVAEGTPSLMVSFDMVHAQAPSSCAPMPGMEDNQTGRFIGDYKFGCGVETAFAKQIARPSDLEGNAELDPRTGRRDAVVIESYMAGKLRQPLEGIEREDLQTE